MTFFLSVLWVVSLQLRRCRYFLPFYRVAVATPSEIKCKQDEDKGKEGSVSSVGGDSNPPRCLPYMASLQPQMFGEKNKLLDTARRQKNEGNGPVCTEKQTVHVQRNVCTRSKALTQFNTHK